MSIDAKTLPGERLLANTFQRYLDLRYTIGDDDDYYGELDPLLAVHANDYVARAVQLHLQTPETDWYTSITLLLTPQGVWLVHWSDSDRPLKRELDEALESQQRILDRLEERGWDRSRIPLQVCCVSMFRARKSRKTIEDPRARFLFEEDIPNLLHAITEVDFTCEPAVSEHEYFQLLADLLDLGSIVDLHDPGFHEDLSYPGWMLPSPSSGVARHA